MGVYEAWFGGSVAGRKVWKHSSRQNYIYFWEWGVNTGSEWMIGLMKQIGFYENEKIKGRVQRKIFMENSITEGGVSEGHFYLFFSLQMV